jgi:heme A synthase
MARAALFARLHPVPTIRLINLLLVLLTFALLILGGVVHATGSSLACPDWPTCYGMLMPPMIGGILFEHSHRLLAASVATLTLVLAGLARWSRPRGDRITAAAFLALGLVLVQAVLGGITVILKLSLVISTAHLAVGMLMFCTLVWIALNLEGVPATPQHLPGRTRHWTLAALLGCYLQILLGGLVRHSGAALACPEVPGCGAEFWPALANTPAQIQMAHRVGAVIVAALIIAAALGVDRAFGAHRPAARAAARAAMGLVAAQIALGLWSVTSRLEVLAVSLHLAAAALLLADLMVLHVYAKAGGSLPMETPGTLRKAAEMGAETETAPIS